MLGQESALARVGDRPNMSVLMTTLPVPLPSPIRQASYAAWGNARYLMKCSASPISSLP